MSAPHLQSDVGSTECDQETYDLIAGVLEVSREQLGIDTSLAEDLGADSLDVLVLIMAMEDRDQRTIPDEAAQMKTVRDVMLWRRESTLSPAESPCDEQPLLAICAGLHG